MFLLERSGALEVQRSYSSNICGDQISACGEPSRLPMSSFQPVTDHDRHAEGDFSWYVQGSSDGQICPEDSLTVFLRAALSLKSSYPIFFPSLAPLLRVTFWWLSQPISFLSHFFFLTGISLKFLSHPSSSWHLIIRGPR